jgi:hypothetical protein
LGGQQHRKYQPKFSKHPQHRTAPNKTKIQLRK